MWMYIPNTSISSPSAPEEPDLISASSWQFQALEASAWSRGKPSRSRNWYQLWKRAYWLQRLFGAMPEPSTADSGVALWMASLAASRASLIALLGSNSGKKTSETCGQQPAASSSSRARGSSSSKTSVGCCLRAVRNECGETFTAWGSRLREDCSRRKKSARAMSANAYSSSPWPTPLASDDGRKVTPASHQNSLIKAAANWTTPSATDGQRGGTITEAMSGTSLAQQVRSLWSTPSVADVQGGRKSRSGERNQELLMNGQAEQLCSRLDQTTLADGETSSTDRRSLNPLFVEWLMGWPPGWTLLSAGPELTDFACSEMASYLSKLAMRSALLQLGLPREAPSAQLALFG